MVSSRVGLGFASLLWTLGLVACSQPTAPGTVCSQASCDGCCRNNQCVTDPDDTACGIGGSRCQTCSSTEECTEGTCVEKPCDGCIEPGTGECVDGYSNDACGAFGTTCATCPMDATCVGGVCESSSCGGCVDGTGACKSGTLNTQCGKSGTACMACTGGETCQNRECVGASTCDSSTCPDGCCDENDQCQDPGDTAAACGTGGAACEVCSGTATCEGGRCTSACGPGNATGCCDDSGMEQASTTAHCGENGVACVACAVGEICSSGQCIGDNCSTTCAGCCSTASCLAGDTAMACGIDGQACVACGTAQTCSSGVCIVDPSSTWDLLLVSGEVPSTNAAGQAWDSSGGFPDPYVEMILDYGGAMSNQVLGPSVSNTTTPNWQSTRLYNGVTSALLQKVTYVYVRDDDTRPANDLIGVCAIHLRDRHFDGQTWIFTCPLPAGETPTATRQFRWKVSIKLRKHV